MFWNSVGGVFLFKNSLHVSTFILSANDNFCLLFFFLFVSKSFNKTQLFFISVEKTFFQIFFFLNLQIISQFFSYYELIFIFNLILVLIIIYIKDMIMRNC